MEERANGPYRSWLRITSDYTWTAGNKKDSGRKNGNQRVDNIIKDTHACIK